MTKTNDAPAPAIRCTYCGDTRTVMDRVDGEITCPECGYDKPAPAPSGSGVRVKPLEWNPFRAETPFGYYHVDDQTDLSPGELKGRAPFLLAGARVDLARYRTLDEAKAAAQADYEARILSALALAPAASPSAEDVLRERVAEEREACAKVSEDYPAHQHGHLDADPHYAAQQAAHEIAAAIRARSNTGGSDDRL